MRVGPLPMPVAAPDAIGFDEVTNGYVPWSRSAASPAPPSNSMSFPSSERTVDEQRDVAHVRAQVALQVPYRSHTSSSRNGSAS